MELGGLSNEPHCSWLNRHPRIWQTATVVFAAAAAYSLYQFVPESTLAEQPRLTLAINLFVIFLWATQIVPSGYAGLIALMLFASLDLGSKESVYSFWISPIAFLVIASYLIARAVEKSGLGERIASWILTPFVTSYRTLIASVYAAGLLLTLVIPHPFARAFIVLAAAKAMYDHLRLEHDERASVGLAIFSSASINSLIFYTGDSALNPAISELTGIPISWLGWFQWMGVPSLLLYALSFVVHLLVFPGRGNAAPILKKKRPSTPFSVSEKWTLGWLVIAMTLWATDTWHGIHPGWVAVFCVFGMVLPIAGPLLGPDDFKTVKIDVLLFMAAAIAIGKVSEETGLSAYLADLLFPDKSLDHPLLIVGLLTLAGMAMHFFIGSAFSLVSFMVPMTVILMQQNMMNPIVGAMIVYICAKAQWFFPFHVMDLMIGMEPGGYAQRQVIRLGAAMMIPLMISILFFYLPWWWMVGWLYTG